MKLKELLEQYSNVELTEEQEKQIKDYLGIKNSKKWKPKNSEKYFYINCYGEIDYAAYDNNDEADVYELFVNNCFKTKQEAEFRLEQIKVYNELKNFADENNDEIDWKDDNENQYLITYNHRRGQKGIDIYATISTQDIGQIGFSSRQLAEQAIEKVGADRITKYLFGVE